VVVPLAVMVLAALTLVLALAGLVALARALA
jgi:hypothetical protein